jgi:hypothetical protein
LKTKSQRNAELPLRLTSGALRFLSLLLIELILPRLIHQIRERAKIHPARLHGAGRACAAKLVGNAVRA